MSAMRKQYGNRAERVFYASRSKGTIKGVDKPYRKGWMRPKKRS